MVSDESWRVRATGQVGSKRQSSGSCPDLNGAALESTLWYSRGGNLGEYRDDIVTETESQW